METKMNIESKSYPDLMTEKELVDYLRISKISTSKNHRNVIRNLKSARGLPRINLCRTKLYPLKAIREWLDKQTYTT